MRINHNVTALNAWRNLTTNDTNMAKSLEKLSSGYRINRAADDPAGLVISEKLRAEIAGVGQAVNNTQDAVSMVQVAEGALVEINTLLNSMRALALHAANTGASSANAIAADQQQIDSAVDSIASIASNTSYLGRYLLNGDSGNGTTVNSTDVSSLTYTVGAATPTGNSTIDIAVVTGAAAAASWTSSAGIASAVAALSGSITIGTTTIALVCGTTLASAFDIIVSSVTSDGLSAYTISTGGAGQLKVTSNVIGAGSTVHIVDNNGGFNCSAVSYSATTVGVNAHVTVNGSAATISGNTIIADTGTTFAGMTLVMATMSATQTASGSSAGAVTVQRNEVTFQIGALAAETQVVSIDNVNVSKIGLVTGAANGLNDIKAGATFALATAPSSALKVIDQAISDIASMRANLGSITKNVFETKIRSLEISRENLTASESRIRDVDMAQEMMEFTKNQILTQASTSMLAQANNAPQSILQLLSGR